MLIRPCRAEDLAGIEAVVSENRSQLSTLPRDRAKLQERIEHSMRSFAQEPEQNGRAFFLFVMQDSTSGEIVGTSGINMNNDKSRPFYSYRLDELIHSSPKLNVHSAVPVLYLTHELTGHTVLSSLSIKEPLRNSEYFSLLSRSRLMFIRQFKKLFSTQLAVEIQGVQDDNGQSPFWDSLGRHFFDMDFATADYYSGVKSRTFIAEMMPQHPIYVPLLTPEAQKALGQADARAAATCALLYREGFKSSKHFDIFDGGPTLLGERDELLTIRQTQQKQMRRSDINMGMRYMVANQSLAQFRCTLTQMTDGIGEVLRLNRAVADLLELDDGDDMTYVPL